MSDYRFPTIAGAVRWQGAVVHLNHGQVWPADDPFVKARPDLFSAEPHELTRSQRPAPVAVEGDEPRPSSRRAGRGKG